jgi:multidrug efflux pump
MNVLEAILRRPRTVLTLMIVMVIAGVFTYLTIPKESDPDIDVPVFYVSIVHEGISPEDAVRLLIKPMETELRGLDGLKEITATASQGHASIVLEFKTSVDHDEASTDVREKVDQARSKLPTDAKEPTVHEINFSLAPIIAVVISGDVPERTLYRHARRLKDQIEAIPTVLEANLAGHREELLEVIIDRTRLESYNISQQQLINAVVRNNQLVTAGFMDSGATGGGRFNVKVPGLFETAQDVYDLPIVSTNDGVVTLKDIADIKRTFKDRTNYSRFNGKPDIAIQVVKRLGTNVVENSLNIRRIVEEYTKEWPDSIKVDFALDQSKSVFEILNSLQSSILTAIALVMVVVVAALGMRSSLLVGLSIPASFMVSFMILGLAGHTLNMMHMFGMVLTVGILVDAAIVIVEYADRKIAEGLHRRDSYILAAQRMFWPIVSSTATTLVAFLPMIFWPGVAGKFMSYLPLTVIIVLSASLLTAMVFLPVLGGLLGRTRISREEAKTAAQLSGGSHVDYDSIRGLAGMYIRLLRRLVAHPFLVLITSLLFVVAVFWGFGKLAVGVEFFVDTEPEQAFVFVSGRGNMSAKEKFDLVLEVEKRVLQVGGLKSVFTTVGSVGGNMIDGGGQDRPVDLIGQLILEPADYNLRRKGKVILEEIRQKTADISGIIVEVRKREEGPPTGKDIRLQITGGNLQEVEATTRRVRTHFDKEVKNIRDVEDTTPLPGIEWVLEVDRREAARFNTDILSVGSMIQLVTNGLMIGTYRPDDAEDEIDIRVRLPKNERTINQLDQLRVMTKNGPVPLSNFVTRKAKPKVSTITRRDGRYMMMVKANAVQGVLGSDKIKEIGTWLKQQKWPNDVELKFRGADEDQKESGEFLVKAMMGALFMMFIILVTQFNSFYQTSITLLTVVLSLVGVLIGMMVTGQTFSIIMTGTGVVALAGIVVNNSIVLIDTFNHFHKDLKMPVVDAVLRASGQRLRPVLLTTITTICGLAPMALQINLDFLNRIVQMGSVTSIWWVQLSTAIIFGLGFATLLTLVLTPTLLTMPTIVKRQWLRNKARKRLRYGTGADYLSREFKLHDRQSFSKAAE